MFWIKTITSALVIAGVSEIGKRYSWFAAVLASLPLTSILAIVWLYLETNDPTKVRSLSIGIFWAVIPSLLFFVVLYFSLKHEMQFWRALLVSSVVMVAGYFFYTLLLRRLGISL